MNFRDSFSVTVQVSCDSEIQFPKMEKMGSLSYHCLHWRRHR